jgi:hypothetical protein
MQAPFEASTLALIETDKGTYRTFNKGRKSYRYTKEEMIETNPCTDPSRI